ncbi:MAG: hypothetical protein ACE5FF_06825, partial [Saprospiraceae bacterium]
KSAFLILFNWFRMSYKKKPGSSKTRGKFRIFFLSPKFIFTIFTNYQGFILLTHRHLCLVAPSIPLYLDLSTWIDKPQGAFKG